MTRRIARIMGGIHTASGETALLQRTDDPFVVTAQFNRFTHPHSHGWHAYGLSEFEMRDGYAFPSPIKLDSESNPVMGVIMHHGIKDGKTRELVYYIASFARRRILANEAVARNAHLTYKRDELAKRPAGMTGADVEWANEVFDDIVAGMVRVTGRPAR